MQIIKILRDLHDGFVKDDQGNKVPVFYKAGTVVEVDNDFIKKWEDKRIPAFEKVEPVKQQSTVKAEAEAKKGDKK